MSTYLLNKKEEWNSITRRVILAALFLFILFSMGGCGKDKEPGLIPTPTPEGWEFTPVVPTTDPTKPTATPAPGQPEAPTAVPTQSAEIQPGEAWMDALSFAIVTPVPQDQVQDLKDMISKEDFPKVDGSTATIPLSEAVYQYVTGASAEEAGNAIVHTKTSNCYKRLYNKEVDLLIVYEPSDEIVERMMQEELIIKPIGLDALVFMGNTANPVQSLTLEQLVAIYSGKTTNWSEVGGEDKELMAFQRPNGGGSQSLMLKLVMKDIPMMTGDNVFSYATMSDILEGMLSYNGEDNTLGYSVFYYANNMYYLPDLKFIGVNGVLPSVQTIYDGSYPLVNAFYAVIRPDEPEDSTARKVFDWLTGEEGQQTVLDCGYVPVDMPKGASPTTIDQNYVKGQTEVTAQKPLQEGEYFVFFTQQNGTNEYEYGNVTVYDNKWNPIANFYNVVMNTYQTGVTKGRYLPIGQIRMSENGAQLARYGVYDLQEKKYSVTPQFRDLVPLDMDLGYYAVVDENGSYNDYYLIDGTGKVRLESVAMEDWLMISKNGNTYIESKYDYTDWSDVKVVYNIFDLNLNLISKFYTSEQDVPAKENQEPGVLYKYVGSQGCLVDENGEILIDAEKFLTSFGDADSTEEDLVLPFYGVSSVYNENDSYAIEYKGKIYIVDKNLQLCRVTEQKTSDEISYFTYEKDFYSGYNYVVGETQYFSYEESPLTINNTTLPVQIANCWEDGSYLLYAVQNHKILIEEHPSDGEILNYEIPYEYDIASPVVNYVGKNQVYVEEVTGETEPNPFYTDEPNAVYNVNSIVWFYKGNEIYRTKGVSFYSTKIDTDNYLCTIDTGELIKYATESMYEEYDYRMLNHYAIIKNGEVVCEINDPANQASTINGFLQITIGNYIYVMDYSGNVYLKTLDGLLASD